MQVLVVGSDRHGRVSEAVRLFENKCYRVEKSTEAIISRTTLEYLEECNYLYVVCDDDEHIDTPTSLLMGFASGSGIEVIFSNSTRSGSYTRTFCDSIVPIDVIECAFVGTEQLCLESFISTTAKEIEKAADTEHWIREEKKTLFSRWIGGREYHFQLVATVED